MTRRSGPKAAPQTPAKKSKSKITTRWTDVAPNDPPVDHLDPAYVAALEAAVEAGELEEVER